MKFFTGVGMSVLSLGLCSGSFILAGDDSSYEGENEYHCERHQERRHCHHRRHHRDCVSEANAQATVHVIGCPAGRPDCPPRADVFFAQTLNSARSTTLYDIQSGTTQPPFVLPLGTLNPVEPERAFVLEGNGTLLDVLEGGWYKMTVSASFFVMLQIYPQSPASVDPLKTNVLVDGEVVESLIFPPLGVYPMQESGSDSFKYIAMGGTREFLVCIPARGQVQLQIPELPYPSMLPYPSQVISLTLGNPTYGGDSLRVVLEKIGSCEF